MQLSYSSSMAPVAAVWCMLLPLQFLSTSVTAQQVIAEAEFAGDPTHGTNIFNDEIMTTFPSLADILDIPWAGTFSVYDFWAVLSFFPEIGVYDPTPGAVDAKRIDSTTPLNSIMASKWDDRAGLISDQPPEIQATYNVPIHDPYQIAGLNGVREQIPATTDFLTSKLQFQRNTVAPITLEQWNSVTGDIELKCFNDGTGLVKIEAQNLIPDGVYTVWSLFALTDPPAFFENQFNEFIPPGSPELPVAMSGLGGAPMTLLADDEGEGKFSRDLVYCPLDLTNPLMYVALLYHWDHSLYGAAPQAALLPESATGLVASNHLFFRTGDYLVGAWEEEEDD